MNPSRHALDTITATVADGVDGAHPRSRTDLELAVLVLEGLSDAIDGWGSGTTMRRFGDIDEAPTVVLLRRLANAHHRIGVAERRGELSDAIVSRLSTLAGSLQPGAGGDGIHEPLLVPSLACC